MISTALAGAKSKHFKVCGFISQGLNILVCVSGYQTLWRFITSKQGEREILKCIFDNLLEITTTALIFQSVHLVANVKPSRKFEKHYRECCTLLPSEFPMVYSKDTYTLLLSV